MPDEDKFERHLKGKGWRRAYRLAAGNAPLPNIVDALIPATAEAMRRRVLCPSLQEIVDVVCDALTNDARGFSVAENMFGNDQLTAKLDAIQANDIGFPGTPLAIKAAEECFIALTPIGPSVSRKEVQNRFAETFVSRVIDHQCLSRVRAGIAEQNSRNVEQQAVWEQELRQEMKSQARKLLENALKSPSSESIRAPKRLSLRSTIIEVQLHEPLIPLEKP